ncbi:hypothetical protein [Sporohalobacter salinus]|uniref:hypothetical protein n=1 Tax=Sporohalobacter salinus TaxID=1494606 RepID=UPI00195FC186|nr:hypothetical protein [Sporohalobacter salinus]MBM7622990.1 hypothetical protein [Sporohalobacter salinus]
MTLEYIRFMTCIVNIGVFIFYGGLLFLGNKYNVKLELSYKLFIIWLGSLSLGVLIGIDFWLQGLKRTFEFLL